MMRNVVLLGRMLIAAVGACTCMTTARAATETHNMTLAPMADSWIQDEGGNSRNDNFGASDLMAVGGRWWDTYFRAFIRFDLSSIPPDATIDSAGQRLYHALNAVEATNVNRIGLYAVLKDWDEREVTWNRCARALPWTTPGADAIGRDREDVLLARRSFTSATPVNRYYDFDVTAAIQDYVDGIKPNHGFILIGKETPATNRYFNAFSTKESASNRPFLRVTYRIPIIPDSGRFQRGDCNADGKADLGDAVFALNYQFGGGAAPTCLKTADVNDDGRIDMGDPISLLNYLFGGGAAPPPPLGACGPDPTADMLSCNEYLPCP